MYYIYIYITLYNTHGYKRSDNARDINIMEGPTSTRAVTIQVKSCRTYESTAKRARIGPLYTGLALFRHSNRTDEYAKWITADSALQLLDEDDKNEPDFIGLSFITDREIAGFKTCAVGGIVNALNTGIWKIYQFDAIYAVILPAQVKPHDGYYTHPLYNKSRDFTEEVAIICSMDHLDDIDKNYPTANKIRIGVAMSSVDVGGPQDSHMFSILLDKPSPHN